MTKKDEFWGFVKARKPQRTDVNSHSFVICSLSICFLTVKTEIYIGDYIEFDLTSIYHSANIYN
ncbi:MAG: hypothetical protein R3Y51_05190 [Rikenellaceae bacterium]